MGNQGGSIHSDTSSRFAKKTTEHHSDQFSYAVSHMKGSPSNKKDGDSTWKMPAYTSSISPPRTTTSSQS
jgi:hypothetical protein